MTLSERLKAIGKVIVSGAGLLLVILNEVLPIVPAGWKTYVSVAIGLLTLLAGYHAPYAPIAKRTRRATKRASRKPRKTTRPATGAKQDD